LRLLFHDYFLFLGGLEVARLIGLAPQTLDRVHDVALLGENGVAEFGGPVEFFVHHFQNVWEFEHRLHARSPVFILGGSHQFFALECGVLFDESRCLDDFDRVGRCREHLGYQVIRIQRNGGQELIELLRPQGRFLRLLAFRLGTLLGLRLRSRLSCLLCSRLGLRLGSRLRERGPSPKDHA